MQEVVNQEVVNKAANRRSFLSKLGIAGAAVTGASVLVEGNKAKAQFGFGPGPAEVGSDIDILNFALNLEYLEAEFYTVATTGQYLSQLGFDLTGTGTPGATTGGLQVSLAGVGVLPQIAAEITYDEQQHVKLIRSTIISLGGMPIAKPAINLNALMLGFGSATEFVTLGRIFEDIGVTAYGGAAPLLNLKAIIGAAARILATEAEHVSLLRAYASALNAPPVMLDGADIPLPPAPGGRYISVNANALTEVRTPGQVLYLAYGMLAGVSAGGFFPNGVNGQFTMSTAPAVLD